MTQEENQMAPPSFFGLLRHGETVWNREKKIQGLKDSPLTPNGINRTRDWLPTLKRYNWDQIHASDLGRVRQTVEILSEGLNLPVHFDPRLQEQSWGEWEGRTLASIKENDKEDLAARVARGWEFSAPGGESRRSVRDRVFAALGDIASKTPGKKTLIVCHQGIIKIILYHLSDRAYLPEENNVVSPNKLHLICHQDGGFAIDTLNIEKGDG